MSAQDSDAEECKPLTEVHDEECEDESPPHSHGGVPGCTHGHGDGPQSHLHGHSHLPSASSGHFCLLAFTVTANTQQTIVQLNESIVIGSIAMINDADDMTADVVGYAMNLYAEWYGQQPGKSQRSRLKLEVASATFTTCATLGLSTWIIYDAAKRLEEPSDEDMKLGGWIVGFASVGLVFNIVSLGLFYFHGLPMQCSGDKGELNLLSAALHLLGDTMRMIVILGSGLYILISGTQKSEEVDAWCAMSVSIMSMILTIPVIYGIVLTVMSLCNNKEDETDLAPTEGKFDKLSEEGK